MTTHGNILVKNADKSGLEYWLHAYSDGHDTDAFSDLKTLAEWIVQRALLRVWQSEQIRSTPKGSDKAALKWGALGPWQLTMFEDSTVAKVRKNFDMHWQTSLGVNIDYCGAEQIASLMVQRHFNRWICMGKEDTPYYEVDKPPDFTVLCDDSKKSYQIIPHDDLIDEYDEVEICTV